MVSMHDCLEVSATDLGLPIGLAISKRTISAKCTEYLDGYTLTSVTKFPPTYIRQSRVESLALGMILVLCGAL